MNEPTEYVVGFLFSHSMRDVVLIKKNKPEWQAGRYNGVGGKIEEGEMPFEAMCREFREEAGVNIFGWESFITLRYAGDVSVHFFRRVLSEQEQHLLAPRIRSCTAEKVLWFSLYFGTYGIPGVNTLPNLKWLVPMAATGAKAGVLEIETEGDGGFDS